MFEEAGTTSGRRGRARDLAGRPRAVRRHRGVPKAVQGQGVEYYSFLRAAERAIERAHVALLVLDASEGSPARTSGSPPG